MKKQKLNFSGVPAVGTAAAGKAGLLSAIWTFPSMLLAAFIISWGAEAAQFLVSQGMALAILAWLQTMPEFAVEAAIAWGAGKDPSKIPLMSANFTGSIRLIVGLAWPMIYFVRAVARKHRKSGSPLSPIELDPEHSVEVLALVPAIIYFFIIWLKGNLTVTDSFFLFTIYIVYLIVLLKIPPLEADSTEELPAIPRWVMHRPKKHRGWYVMGLFAIGGVLLYFTAHPFLESMLAIAVSAGISQYVFIQWVAPFLSEFPEKVSAFNWARTDKKAPIALMNMVSSNINQITVLIGMVPIVYCISHGSVTPIVFDAHQRAEILLTIAQSTLAMLFIADLRLRWYEAAGLFLLWIVQFCVPHIREEILFIYIGWMGVEVGRYLIKRKELRALNSFRSILVDWNLAKKKTNAQAKKHKPEHKPKPGEKQPQKPGGKPKGKKKG